MRQRPTEQNIKGKVRKGDRSLTGVEFGRAEPQPCVSPPDRPVCVPPPASPSCWHTAPCATGGCPVCWCHPPWGRRPEYGTCSKILKTPSTFLPNPPSWTRPAPPHPLSLMRLLSLGSHCPSVPSHLLKRRMKHLICPKSGLSAGSWAQHRSISKTSSSFSWVRSMLGRKYGR